MCFVNYYNDDFSMMIISNYQQELRMLKRVLRARFFDQHDHEPMFYVLLNNEIVLIKNKPLIFLLYTIL